MPAKKGVETKFTAVDKISKAFKRMGRAAGLFGDDANRSFRKASKEASRFKDVTKGIITANVIGGATSAMSEGVKTAATEFVRFDDAITAATARFKDVKTGSKESLIVMEKLRKKAREIGGATQFSASQAAEGLDFFARAGFTSAEAMAVLESQVNLATATGEDFTRVADISSDLLGAMGLNSQNSAKKIANLKKMNNLLGIATNKANVKMEDLFDTLKFAGPIATSAGESTEKLIAMTAALGSAGIKGTLGATALKNAYIRLLDTTPKVDKALRGVGLSTKDFVDKSGKMKSMTKIMGILGKATKGLGQAEQLKFFSVVFGKQAVAGATNLSKSLSEVDNILKAMRDRNAVKKIADQMRTSFGPKLQILYSTFIEKTFQVFTAFEGRAKTAIDKVTVFIREFDPKPIIDGVNKGIEVLKNLGPTIERVKPFIKTLGKAWLAYKAIVVAVGITQAAMLLTNPFGQAVLAAGALVTAGVFLQQNWKEITTAIIGYFTRMKDMLIFDFNAIGDTFLKVFDKIRKIFDRTIKPIAKTIKALTGSVGLEFSEEKKGVNKSIAAQQAANLAKLGFAPQAPTSPQAPNKEEVRGRVQDVRLQGDINVNAPKGTISSFSGGRGSKINVNNVAAQP